jgi:tetratricopeptide (TPR) repeat protein
MIRMMIPAQDQEKAAKRFRWRTAREDGPYKGQQVVSRQLSSPALLKGKTFAAICTAMFLALVLACAQGQNVAAERTASIEGTVADREKHPVAGVSVSLENTDANVTPVTSSDSQGQFRFADLSSGTYTLRAKLAGWREVSKGPMVLGRNQALSVTLQLERDDTPISNQGGTQGIDFSDEPTFTVAGVSDPTNLGGHGSDVVMRTKESLAKATVSLNSANIAEEKQRVAALRAGQDSAELHALLGDIAESEGRPLEAVREYQRAAEMEPSEVNLFAWGTELLLHRALEPASEVFRKGHRLFPRSARMLVGLGVTSYARGRSEEAAQQLADACDLDPAEQMPYLFLGKMQSADKIEPVGWSERLNRFVSLYPGNALAHYYYAVALTKNTEGTEDSAVVESSLLKAIELDPQLGDAYLQLGILYTKQKDFVKAIPAYQKAIEKTPFPDEAHFRLAEAYRLTGEGRKAHEEIQLYEQISKEKTRRSEQERHELPQFVYTLRGQSPPSPQPGSQP